MSAYIQEEGDGEVAKLRAEIRKLEEKNAALSEFKAELEDRVDAQKRYNKVGRNEPCPCGSGKKYKHCCGK
jgi:preprotein translocase subunit SecA